MVINDFEIKPFNFHKDWAGASVQALALASLVALVVILPVRMLEFQTISSDVARILYILLTPVAGGLSGIIFALIQRKVLRQRLYWAADEWLKYTVIGAIPGGVLVSLYVVYGMPFVQQFYPDTAFYYAVPFYLFCVSITQIFALHKVVSQSWLWVVANVTSGIAGAAILVTIDNSDPLTGRYMVGFLSLLGFLAIGLSQSSVLYYLFTRHPVGKRKNHF